MQPLTALLTFSLLSISVVSCISFCITVDQMNSKHYYKRLTPFSQIKPKKRLGLIFFGGPLIWIGYPISLFLLLCHKVITGKYDDLINWSQEEDEDVESVEALNVIIAQNEEKVREFEEFKKKHPEHFNKHVS